MSFDSPLCRTSHETSPVEAPRASDGENHGSGAALVPPQPAGERQGGGPLVADSKKVRQFRLAGHLVRIELVDDVAGLVALGDEWDQLFHDHGKAHQCFQSHAWCHHWCNHYLNKCAGDADRLVIVTARLDGELILVCPLAAYTQGGIVHLHWLGAPVSQYGDVLMSDHPAAPALLKAGLEFAADFSDADLLDLRKVRRDSAAGPVLREIGALSLNKDQACYMDLASSHNPEAYAQRHSARSRKQRRRRRRRLAEQGGLEFLCVEAGRKASRDAAATVQEKTAVAQAHKHHRTRARR